MITNKPSILLKSIADSDLDEVTTTRLLLSVEQLFLEENFDILPLDFIAIQIHSLYAINSTPVKCATLSICMTLEQMSPEIITEKYNFDFLVAMSIGKVSSDTQNSPDKEKLMAFAYTIFLFEKCGICPDSIVRSLVSLYQFNKSRYREVAATTICQALSYVPEIAHIPEVCQIVFEHLTETGKKEVASLIAHSIEKRELLVADHSLLMSLLVKIGTISSQQVKANGLIHLLRTWPGLIFFGLQRSGLSSILMCLANQTEAVCEIIRGILCFDAPDDSIIVPFCLFALDYILPLDIVGRLDSLKTQKTSAEKLLNDLLPLITVHLPEKFTVQKLQQRLKPPPAYISSSPPQNPIINVSEINLAMEPTLWDWAAIKQVLTIVLPHSETEANSQPARLLYSKLFDFFSSSFLMVSAAKFGPIPQSMLAMIELLMKWQWGFLIIESNAPFKNTVSRVLDEICGETPIEANSPIWMIFRAISLLMCRNEGVATLSRWGILSKLQKLGATCKNIQNAENVLCRISLYPDPELSVAVFAKFLSSTKDEGMHKAALDELRAKQNEPGNFCTNVFNGIIMPHIKELYGSTSTSKLKRCLALFNEVIKTHEDCLLAAAQDMQMHQLLSNSNKSIYAMVLAANEAQRFCDIEKEIDYWIEEGNKKYVEVFDVASTASFMNTVDAVIVDYPEILKTGRHAQIPAHLFSELSKNQTGRDMLEKKLPLVIEKCSSKSIKERRGAILAIAHFCSIPENAEVADSMDLVDCVISALNRTSYVLLGTVTTALSMFFATQHFMESISQKFKLVRSAGKTAIIPCDVLSMLDDQEEKFETCVPSCEVPEALKPVYTLVMQLSNQLLIKETKTTLNNIIKSDNSPFIDPGFAFLINKTMSQCTIQADIRANLYQILDGTPLMRLNAIEVEIDKREMSIANIMIEKASLMKEPNLKNIVVTEEEINGYHSFGSSYSSFGSFS